MSQPAAIGRPGQVCDRWIYSACLCFGLDSSEQARSGFACSYSVYQAEYSRNLLFASGGQIEELSSRVPDRTRSRLDIPSPRTVFGLKNRPHRNRASGPPAQEIVIEKPQYGLTWFKVRFGLLQARAYLKGEHVLRMEATVRNTRELRCRRGLEHFPEIITRLAGMAGRFATALDCAVISFIADGILDELPRPARIGATRTGWPRPEQAPHPRRPRGGPGSGRRAPRLHRRRIHRQDPRHDRAGRLHHPTGAYDLRKLRGKDLAVKPARTRRYHIPPAAARTIAALLALRDQVIAPILAGVRSPRRGRKPAHWTRIDRHYETLRTGMQTLFHDLGITPIAA
ncbi:MAG: hypothetical protein ACLPUO_06360 [Streptosporangiaceae bacterium]